MLEKLCLELPELQFESLSLKDAIIEDIRKTTMIFKCKSLTLDNSRLKKRRGQGEWFIEDPPNLLRSITYLNYSIEFYPFLDTCKDFIERVTINDSIIFGIGC